MRNNRATSTAGFDDDLALRDDRVGAKAESGGDGAMKWMVGEVVESGDKLVYAASQTGDYRFGRLD